jgi:hypothetical protein
MMGEPCKGSAGTGDLHNPFRIGAQFYTYLGLPDNKVGQPQAVLQNAFSIDETWNMVTD